MPKIQKVLVANRGEIALRVIRSLKEMGIATVAIYSEADRMAPHVQLAEEAVLVGPAPSSKSYLKGQRIIEICKELNVDALHPGYGFLSESADFSRAVIQAGIIFIGPSPESIEIMGNKLRAKAAVSKYNIPMVPGTNEAITSVDKALKQAENIGFPLLIKASAGGGGKGMRVVDKPENFEAQMKRAVSEAESSFGDGAVFLEKYLLSPRHIEIQVLGDQHGNIVHLFERDCSIQRRHQKVVEEAPSTALDPTLRAQMGQAAIEVARSCQYYGAGTVEFMLDADKKFYFLEMNTRLQVEHPVTEAITGIDLVKEQVRIARGETLKFTQSDLHIRGHAIEARIYAEDPSNNFLPDIGTLISYKRPQGPGIRMDDGFEEGMEIPIHYDPMIAKLIVTGNDRSETIGRMIRAIEEYRISGVQTTLDFCKFVMQHQAFISGVYDTSFVEKHFNPRSTPAANPDIEKVAAMFSAHFFAVKKDPGTNNISNHQQQNPWRQRAKDQ